MLALFMLSLSLRKVADKFVFIGNNSENLFGKSDFANFLLDLIKPPFQSLRVGDKFKQK
jgi:hypothetical protein